jgi:benzoyl-CoA reductase subunit D
MITAGIDMGAKTVKIVILKDGKIVAKSIIPGGFDQRGAAEKAFHEVLTQARVSRNEIDKITVTGMGKKEIYMHPPISADHEVTEVTADAKGALYLFPSVRTLIDVGAEEGRGIKCDAQGKVVDFAINEKCAAGAGSFTEAMSRALEVKVEEMGNLSLQSTNAVPMNAQCAVFAESEVVSLVHAKTPKPDIARAIHDAIANRIVSMARRIGIEKDVVLIGGLSRNKGFVDSLKRILEIDKLLIPEEAEFVGAIGAALIAAENK